MEKYVSVCKKRANKAYTGIRVSVQLVISSLHQTATLSNEKEQLGV